MDIVEESIDGEVSSGGVLEGSSGSLVVRTI
jgi:hypothetical protein